MDALPSRTSGETWLTPGRAAAKFGVKSRTVRIWAEAGKLTVKRTLGGHRRYLASEVDTLSSETEAVAS